MLPGMLTEDRQRRIYELCDDSVHAVVYHGRSVRYRFLTRNTVRQGMKAAAVR